MIGTHKLLLPAPFVMDVLSVSLREVYVICETTDDWWWCLYTLYDVIQGNKYVLIVIVIVIVIPKLQRSHDWSLGMNK